MLSRPQQILMKRAQAQAGLTDADYRELLANELGFGVRSSTAPQLTDRHLDKFMAFVEAIFWKRVDEGRPFDAALAASKRLPFQVRGYWAAKNNAQQNSRDRHVSAAVETEIAHLESEMKSLGHNQRYLDSIFNRVGGSPWAYKAALERTLATKTPSENPF